MSGHCAAAVNKRGGLNRSGTQLQRVSQDENVTKQAIFKNDIISVEKWAARLTSMKQKLKEAKEEISNWRGKYENLEKEKEDLYNEMLEEVTNKYVNEQKKSQRTGKYYMIYKNKIHFTK